MLEKLINAKPHELQAWMLGAGIIGLGLGALLINYIQQYASWIILIGIIVHGWAMYKIYTRKE